ncbi:MAG: C25 family cysteine peptidase [Candidatus Bathyarchaeota archaeon]|nr:C25 family cysteine peptidase [Candidatus Bathyarchaeota archaeon]
MSSHRSFLSIVICGVLISNSFLLFSVPVVTTQGETFESYKITFQSNSKAILLSGALLNVLIPPDASVTSFMLSGFSEGMKNVTLTYSGTYSLRCYRFAQAALTFNGNPDYFHMTINVDVKVRRNAVQYSPCTSDELADAIMQRLNSLPLAGYTTPGIAFGNLQNCDGWKGYPILPVNKTQAYQLPDQQVDYLIVASQDMFEPLYPLMVLKSQQGLSTFFVSIQDVDSTYEGNSTQLRTIEFLRDAFNHWHMKYVLLVGNTASVPPIAYTAHELSGDQIVDHEQTGDYYYSLLEQAPENFSFSLPNKASFDFPDFILGRFPFDDAMQVGNLVNKTIAYEQETDPGEWVRTNAMAAGEGWYPNHAIKWDRHTCDLRPKIILGNPGNLSIQSLADVINTGVGSLSMIIHGTAYLLEINSTQHFMYSDVTLLNNTRLPVIFAAVCYGGKFDYGANGEQSLAVQLLARDAGGSVAIVSGTSPSPYALQVYYSTYNYNNGDGQSWLPAANYSIGKALFFFDALNIVEAMILLGDPALVMATAKYDLPSNVQPSPVPLPTMRQTPTPTSTTSPTPTSIPSPSQTPTPNTTPTRTATTIPTYSPSSVPTPQPTATPTPTTNPSPTTILTPPSTPTSTLLQTPTPTLTNTPTDTQTPTPSPSLPPEITPEPSQPSTLRPSPSASPAKTTAPSPSPAQPILNGTTIILIDIVVVVLVTTVALMFVLTRKNKKQ